MTRGVVLALATLTMLLGGFPLPGASAAETPAPALTYVPPQAPEAPSPGPLLARLFSMMLFVLLLCAGVLWGVRYLQRPRLGAVQVSEKLQQLQAVPLAGRGSLHLIQAGRTRVVVAVDPSGLKACHVVEESFAGVLATAQARTDAGGPSVEEAMAILAARRLAA